MTYYGRRPLPGDLVEYRVPGGTRTIRVDGVSDEIKNGMPGFHGHDSDGGNWWGYDSQIVRINRQDIR